jgi:hypothetical protein
MMASANICSVVQDTLADNGFENFNDLMAKINTQHEREYCFGLFLEAAFRDTEAEDSALMMLLPCLGLRDPSASNAPNPQDDEESLTLHQYLASKSLTSGTGNSLALGQVSVHQALFASCNEGV